MLKRREFIRLSAIIAAGAVLPLEILQKATAAEVQPSPRVRAGGYHHLFGHKKSGCAARPEAIDFFRGGPALDNRL